MKRPEGRKVLTSRWLFRVKDIVEQGRINEKAKARLVLHGFQQVQGVDCNDTYAPVVKLVSIRCLLALVAHLNLELHQMDAVPAFLNDEVEEDIFLEIPERITKDGKGDYVCKLIKPFYRLKQAPQCMNEKIYPSLVQKLGFEKCPSDP